MDSGFPGQGLALPEFEGRGSRVRFNPNRSLDTPGLFSVRKMRLSGILPASVRILFLCCAGQPARAAPSDTYPLVNLVAGSLPANKIDQLLKIFVSSQGFSGTLASEKRLVSCQDLQTDPSSITGAQKGAFHVPFSALAEFKQAWFCARLIGRGLWARPGEEGNTSRVQLKNPII